MHQGPSTGEQAVFVIALVSKCVVSATLCTLLNQRISPIFPSRHEMYINRPSETTSLAEDMKLDSSPAAEDYEADDEARDEISSIPRFTVWKKLGIANNQPNTPISSTGQLSEVEGQTDAVISDRRYGPIQTSGMLQYIQPKQESTTHGCETQSQ
ncbi:hypothetical protein BaRGS_00025438 [Batillaria attramentaria]|uniref:Uncharacterized protein n=1 Tax=Batillaria attramentaria TaxID=370345 RepID=A0ABD0K867_9CAEN